MTIDLKQFRLLIHHHDIAWVDSQGQTWLTAGIGRWADALAEHFKEVGLLLHQSAERKPQQDTPLQRANVRLVSLGAPGRGMRDRVPRMRRIRETCRRVGDDYDGLLIRGITPRQHTVWVHTPVAHKAFLLVGSPSSEVRLELTGGGLVHYAFTKHRRSELRQIARLGGALLANSPVHVKEIEDLLGYPAHFVPTSTLQAAEIAHYEERTVAQPWRLFYCGRLDLNKGLRELIGAVAKLNRKGCGAELHLAAKRVEPVQGRLEELSRELGIEDRVKWLGRIPYGGELFRIYRSMDALVLPSYSEGFPRVLWEAAANSLPVIASAVGGIPALWENERHALLIPPKDEDAIVRAVQRLMGDESLRRRMTGEAYALVQGYTVEACAKKLVTTISEIWG